MAGSVTAVEIANRALARTGLGPVQSFDEADGPLEGAVGLIYSSLVDFVLGSNDWHCTRTAQELAALTSPAVVMPLWDYAYQLPADRLGPPVGVFKDYDSRPVTAYQLADDLIHTNETRIVITYHRQVGPTGWPAALGRVIETALCAEFAASIAENQSKSDRFKAQAYGTPADAGRGGEMAIALQMDAYSSAPDVFNDQGGPLLTARR